METVTIALPHHRYDVVIGAGLLRELGPRVRTVAPHARAALLADARVAPLHGQPTSDSLAAAGYDTLAHACEIDEKHKSLDTVRLLYDVLLNHRLERKSPVIALGGGVMGDVVGFVAASYLRGVPFVQCPTTLLAMVDASVGGKVGVNVPQGKNLIGAFHQPHLVVADISTLKTLPARQLRCGLAECVKHGVIRDPALFAWVEQNIEPILAGDEASLTELVARNVAIKADVVMADEKESGLRAILNFGHTFAHAIEATQGYTDSVEEASGWQHGEAVSLGMVAATRLAVDAGRCNAEVLDRLTSLLDAIGLPTRTNQLADTRQLLAAMKLDKKVADDSIRLILPDEMGRVSIVSDAPADGIAAAWDSLRASG